MKTPVAAMISLKVSRSGLGHVPVDQRSLVGRASGSGIRSEPYPDPVSDWTLVLFDEQSCHVRPGEHYD